MTAADILRSYRTAAKAVSAPSAWLRLLMVATHGTEGCPLAHLARGRRAGEVLRTATVWQDQGLVTLGRRPWANRRNLFRHWVTITPTGMKTLALDS